MCEVKYESIRRLLSAVKEEGAKVTRHDGKVAFKDAQNRWHVYEPTNIPTERWWRC